MSGRPAIGIVGTGTMGTGIARVAAAAGHPVVATDASPEARERARETLCASLARAVERGRLAPGADREILGRIVVTDSLDAMADCELVVEAVVERLDVKQSLMRALEAVVAPDALLATNTSSLSIAAVGAACKQAGRVVGMHFFNPPHVMRLVEVVPGLRTDPRVVERVGELARSWGKTVVVARDTPGFIVNRVARPFYGEALRILEEGIADVATIDHAMTTVGGFRMGPFALMDLIGNDVNYAVTETVFRAFYGDARYRPSLTQLRMVEAGLLGRKSGRGFYDYAEGAERPRPVEDAGLHATIVDRIVAMLINEAVDAVFWRVAEPADIDLAMTHGVNYPRGLLAWCDALGAATVLERIEALRATYAEDRYRPSPLLRRMAERGERFFPGPDDDSPPAAGRDGAP